MTGRVDYQRVSLARLRAMWADDRLTVAQIAAECGSDSTGSPGSSGAPSRERRTLVARMLAALGRRKEE